MKLLTWLYFAGLVYLYFHSPVFMEIVDRGMRDLGRML